MPDGVVHAYRRESRDQHVAQVTRDRGDGTLDLVCHGPGGAVAAAGVPEGKFVEGCDWYWVAPTGDSATATETDPAPPAAEAGDDSGEDDPREL